MTRPDSKSLDQNTYLQLLEISRYLTSENDLNTILRMIIKTATDLFNSERCSIFLFDSPHKELFLHTAMEDLSIRFKVDQGIAGEAATKRKVIVIEDAYSDSRFNPAIDQETGFLTRNLLAGPLLDYNGDLVGVLEIINKRKGAFTDQDLHIFKILLAQTGVVLQRARLIGIKLEKTRFENEMDIARKVQQQSLPQAPTLGEGYSVDVYFKPADHVGGDCYDFIEMKDGSMLFLLGDAAGHGLGPALISTQTRALVRGLSSADLPLTTIAHLANDVLFHELPLEKYITLFVGILNPHTHELTYLSAGHEPILLINHAKGTLTELHSMGLPLGMFQDVQYGEEKKVILEEDSVFIVLTDGVSEYKNRKGDLFGVHGVISSLRKSQDAEAEEIMASLLRDVLTYGEGTQQDDDLTAIIVKRSSDTS